jgi:hypothetical protein
MNTTNSFCRAGSTAYVVRREFVQSDHLTDACAYVTNLPEEVSGFVVNSDSQPLLLNIGSGGDLIVHDLTAIYRKYSDTHSDAQVRLGGPTRVIA